MPRSGGGARFRLGQEIAARRHRVDGRALIALPDARDGRLAVIGEREWTLLRQADGTRDAEGVRVAAERAGARVTREGIERFFAELAEAGLLAEDGDPRLEAGERAAAEPGGTDETDKELVPLPGYRLRCDGRGSCCRIYPTTLFSEPDATRARALAPDVLDAGEDASRAFTPSRGSYAMAAESAGGDYGGLAVAMVDGACAFWTPGGCRVHAAGGPRAKPAGCRLYPASFVDEGERVSVTVLPECACAFRSARTPGVGDVLTEVNSSSGLDTLVHVEQLPVFIAITEEVQWPRARYLAWQRGLAMNWSERVPGDGARTLLSLADSLLGSDPGPSSSGALPLEVELARELAELVERARRRSVLHEPWRSAFDLARLVPRWLVAAGACVQRHGSGEPASEDEAFYVRAVAHGHLWIEDGRTLSCSLRRRAARILLARRLADAARAEGFERVEPALEHPLALVEADARWL
ncbi:MAG: YkgJ family cysteine cluster protein [Deltaproteobacteria bacterium]|nr:YkgJ family cysteine cluster protein [Deltaproteobacteria bacterium]